MDEDNRTKQNGEDSLQNGVDIQDGREPKQEPYFAPGRGSIPVQNSNTQRYEKEKPEGEDPEDEKPKDEKPEEEKFKDEKSKEEVAPAGVAFDESQVNIELEGLDTFVELQRFISDKRGLRTLKVITLVGPGTAGKTFLLFRLNDVMKNHVLYGFHGNDLMKKPFDYLDRSNKICGYYYESSELNSGGTDYLVLDCPGERYDRFIDHLTQSTAQRTGAVAAPSSIANIAACLYWTDAIALALPAMPVLNAGSYVEEGDSLIFKISDRRENVRKVETLIRNFMRFRQCISEIHTVRRRARGIHKDGLPEMLKLLAQYVVNDKDAADLCDIPVKLMLTQADEMIEFSTLGADCDAAIVPLIEKQRKNDGRLTTTLANQFTFASWDFITAFDMPNKAINRAGCISNPKTPQYSTAHYGLADLLPRWLDDHAPLPLLIRPDDTVGWLGKIQWRWRRARTGLRPFLLQAGKLLGWPAHVASKDLLPLTQKAGI